MPRRDDIESVLVIGSGPIRIGQACEFDYSGSQACRVLRSEGYRVVLANSNPATIMTDPEMADRTYVEPLSADVLAAIVERERPDALLATLGGQTALNLAVELSEQGVLDRLGVEVIGAGIDAIRTAENRSRFKAAMGEIGLEVAPSGFAHSLDEAVAVAGSIGYPVIIRPSFILGGQGTGIARDEAELVALVGSGLAASPVSEVLVETSVVGWKEYELEVMRDRADSCVVVCSIENLDPMGIHTGDSITVAPAQTLSDVEYQVMRDAALACIRRIGVETGGSNIQFAVHPRDGRMIVVEMNPRVSRSSALASKATGFPIAKIAARLAVGYTLDEIANDITRSTPACFEPAIDYVVTKVPRWDFRKFPDVDSRLGTSMRSVGEAMAIGRTFPESLQKALRSLDQGRAGLNCDPAEVEVDDLGSEELMRRMSVPTPERIFQAEAALRRGITVDDVCAATSIDPWFVHQIELIVTERRRLAAVGFDAMTRRDWRRAKRLGFADAQLAHLLRRSEREVRATRLADGVRPTFKAVDTCAAEFAAVTPYHYSTYEDGGDEIAAVDRPAVVILGSGPNRIGQGIEFDYCCVHACLALGEAGFDTVMVNCNPETVSTDYDTSSRLHFEPLTVEHVLDVLDAERRARDAGVAGVIVTFGGQTPLTLASRLPAGMLLGTPPESIEVAEDRRRWAELCARIGVRQPPGGAAVSVDEAVAIAGRIGYPVLVRPSYVLGGLAMEIVTDEAGLRRAVEAMVRQGSTGRDGGLSPDRPVLVDRFLEGATEVDVDALRDRTGDLLVAGVMEQVERAGIHSGDSACVIPPLTLSTDVVRRIEEQTRVIADALGVVGLVNIQYAVTGGDLHVIEANPRASRTIPFVAKATGVPLAKAAARVMVGATLAELRAEGLLRPSATGHVAVKEVVLPFDRFPESDPVLSPQMRSTGEVMAIGRSFPEAYAKSQAAAAGCRLPVDGTVLLCLGERDCSRAGALTRLLRELGFRLAATAPTAARLGLDGAEVDVLEPPAGARDAEEKVERIDVRGVGILVVTASAGEDPLARCLRRLAIRRRICSFTTVEAAEAALRSVAMGHHRAWEVRSLQEVAGTAACAPAGSPRSAAGAPASLPTGADVQLTSS